MVSFIYSWIPTCAKLFVDQNELWQDLVPPNDTDSTQLVEEFFACVAALMSIQLRSMVINSLADFLSFFEHHKVCTRFYKSVLTMYNIYIMNKFYMASGTKECRLALMLLNRHNLNH